MRTETGLNDEGLVRHLPNTATRDGLLLTGLTLLVLLTAWPFSPAAMGDDVSYAETARTFLYTGHFVYNGWATASLGWLVPWGAMFLRLFGDSDRSLIASTIVLGLAGVFVWHRVLLRFGASRRNAVLGMLAVSLSPLYLILLPTFLTDIPAYVCVMACLWMCQRAVLAESDRGTALWLLAAAGVNLASGTVRQICWLGALVMVPSTAWLLRRRRGALWVGMTSLVAGVVFVKLFLAWLYRHPYTVPEKLVTGSMQPKVVVHFGIEWIKAALLLTVILAPLTAAWMLQARLLTKAAWVRVGMGMIAAVGFLAVMSHHPIERFGAVIFPWLEPIYESLGFPYGVAIPQEPAVLGLFGRCVLTVLVVGCCLVSLELLLLGGRLSLEGWQRKSPAMVWLILPYSVAYLALISGRAAFGFLQDRYLLLVAPMFLLLLLRAYEQQIAPRLPAISFVVVACVAVFTAAALETQISSERALMRLDARWRAAGMPRSIIIEGRGRDIAEQIRDGGHINDPHFASLPGGFDASIPRWNLPAGCEFEPSYWFSRLRPMYYVAGRENPQCFEGAEFASEPYIAWLPPFHREQIVLKGVSVVK